MSNFEWPYSNFVCSFCSVRWLPTNYVLVRTQPPCKFCPPLLLQAMLLMYIRHPPRVNMGGGGGGGGGIYLPSSNPLLILATSKSLFSKALFRLSSVYLEICAVGNVATSCPWTQHCMASTANVWVQVFILNGYVHQINCFTQANTTEGEGTAGNWNITRRMGINQTLYTR